MGFSLIPAQDRTLATRLRRQLMGLMSYLMFLGPLVYSIEHGWVAFDYRALGLFLGVSLAVNIAFFVVIRSGRTRKFADPSMMALQIALAALLALVIGYFVAAEAMIITLMLFFTAFFFGVFSFTTRQYLGLASVASLCYLAMLAMKYPAAQRATAQFRLEMLHFMVLSIILLWMSLLGSYVAAMRLKLVERSEALASALARLKELASRDELTGLHNRRHLMEVLDQQEERSKRHGERFSLCILDIDYFKRINDTHGHGVGDEVLKAFSERIRSQLRRMDTVGRGDAERVFGRYGGEEFLLLLPYAQGSSALACATRLHAAVHATPFETSAGPMRITFSAGIAEHREEDTIAELINRADSALYRAKSSGRDRLETAD